MNSNARKALRLALSLARHGGDDKARRATAKARHGLALTVHDMVKASLHGPAAAPRVAADTATGQASLICYVSDADLARWQMHIDHARALKALADEAPRAAGRRLALTA